MSGEQSMGNERRQADDLNPAGENLGDVELPSGDLECFSDSRSAFESTFSKLTERRSGSSDSRIINDRAYPPVSMADTVIFCKGDEMRALHDPMGAKFISDKSVLHVNTSKREWNFAPEQDIQELSIGAKEQGVFVITTQCGVIPVAVTLDEHGEAHHLIPQQAHRSCVYTGGTMILLDLCSKHGITDLDSDDIIRNVIMGNLGNNEIAVSMLNRALENTGFEARVTVLEEMTPVHLMNALRENGPAKGGIGGEIGGHAIVLEKVVQVDDRYIVTMRDPFHGWDIDVDFESLKKRGLGKGMVQIVSKDS